MLLFKVGAAEAASSLADEVAKAVVTNSFDASNGKDLWTTSTSLAGHTFEGRVNRANGSVGYHRVDGVDMSFGRLAVDGSNLAPF